MIVWKGIIEHYRRFIQLPEAAPSITLLEGNTPLISMPRLAEECGAGDLFIKFEGVNPTGSFKDRGMTVAITEAAHRGASTVLCASTGNTAASAAAFAARAGLRCLVVLPEGCVATGKLSGAIAHGAWIIELQGSFDEALALVVEMTRRSPIALVNSLNPYRLEGQKTAAFEICDALGHAPDWLALPVGNAGNITSYWMGFCEYDDAKGTGLPHLLGAQAAGAAPLVLGRPVEEPETYATAIRIGRPARGDQALEAAERSSGRIVAVTDDEIQTSQRLLAQEGLWVEPASAAGLAALRSQVMRGELLLKDQTVVCVCTGHGLKDPEKLPDHAGKVHSIPASISALEEVIESL
jgi:threonine synthase